MSTIEVPWTKRQLLKPKNVKRRGCDDPNSVLDEIMENWDAFQEEIQTFSQNELEAFKKYFNDLFDDADVGDAM